MRTDSPTPLPLKVFRLSVALGLVGAEKCLPKKGQPSTTAVNHFKRTVPYEVRYDSCAHMPIYGKPGRCGLCSSKAEPHKSRWHCTKCEVALCPNDSKNCFMEYHYLKFFYTAPGNLL
ncbi:hypothetical protein YQE_00108, partial [Dendroctonus ponderosae]